MIIFSHPKRKPKDHKVNYSSVHFTFLVACVVSISSLDNHGSRQSLHPIADQQLIQARRQVFHVQAGSVIL